LLELLLWVGTECDSDIDRQLALISANDEYSG